MQLEVDLLNPKLCCRRNLLKVLVFFFSLKCNNSFFSETNLWLMVNFACSTQVFQCFPNFFRIIFLQLFLNTVCFLSLDLLLNYISLFLEGLVINMQFCMKILFLSLSLFLIMLCCYQTLVSYFPLYKYLLLMLFSLWYPVDF